MNALTTLTNTKVFRVLRLSLLMAIFAWSTQGAYGLERPLPFIAVFNLHHSGAKVGETTIELARVSEEGDLYEMTSFTKPRGLASFVQRSPAVEESRFEWNDAGEQLGVSYDFNDGSRKGKRNSRINFDWEKMSAASSYKEKEVEIELQEPIADRLALQALLMRDLSRDSLRSSYSIVDKNVIKTYNFELLGEEVLDTAAGRFQAVKISQQREGSSRHSHLWLAKEHGYAMVKLMQFKDAKPRTVLTITRIYVAPKPVEYAPEVIQPETIESDQGQ